MNLSSLKGQRNDDFPRRPRLLKIVQDSLPGILVALMAVYINDARQDDRLNVLEKENGAVEIKIEKLAAKSENIQIISATHDERIRAVENVLEKQNSLYSSGRK